MIGDAVFLTDAPDEEAHRIVSEGLGDHAREQVGYWDLRPLAVLARDPATRRVLGGFIGRTSLGLMFLDMAFLPKELRNRGLGSSMLRMAEEEAARRGCRAGVLYTINSRAPSFYERSGWREFARIPCHPPGTYRIYMTKDFAREAS